MGTELFPALNTVPDERYAAIKNQLWDAVDISLDPIPPLILPPLPRPKPDLAFGYSQVAFNTNQRIAFDLQVNELEKTYSMSGRALRFPFLQIEFKAQANGGNQFIAANQVANAGAITVNRLLEVNRRISAETNFDINMPQFFSQTMDHGYGSVNVHWPSHSAENSSFSFGSTINLLLSRHKDLESSSSNRQENT